MRKLYGDKRREKSGISQALTEIASEVVEKSPFLMRGVAEAEKLKDRVEQVVDQFKKKI
jgi:hypothetical protein